MIAVDTNVVVRLLVDDPGATAQNIAARALFAREQISLSPTVIMEAEWVMRRGFAFSKLKIAEALHKLLAMPAVLIVGRDKVRSAVDALAQGCDFADALHACMADAGVEAFLTFDKNFVKRAKVLIIVPDVRLLAA